MKPTAGRRGLYSLVLILIILYTGLHIAGTTQSIQLASWVSSGETMSVIFSTSATTSMPSTRTSSPDKPFSCLLQAELSSFLLLSSSSSHAAKLPPEADTSSQHSSWCFSSWLESYFSFVIVTTLTSMITQMIWELNSQVFFYAT